MSLNLPVLTSLEVVTTGAGITLHPSASWVELEMSTQLISLGAVNTAAITGAATTTIVAAPAAGFARSVTGVRLRNADAADAVTLTVQINDGVITSSIVTETLAIGETLFYEEGAGWQVMDAAGGIKQGGRSGRYLRTTILTAGTTFNVGFDTNSIFVRAVGAGGGGAGCTSVAAAASAGGGGGAGAYAEKTFPVTPGQAVAYTIGAAGIGVSGAAGTNGTSTTLTVAGSALIAGGGSGAVVATANAALRAYAGGAGGLPSGAIDDGGQGMYGDPGFTLIVATSIVCSGNGGSSIWGGGGVGRTTVGDGVAGSGKGSGGGGAATGASTARIGGDGTAGQIVVTELS